MRYYNLTLTKQGDSKPFRSWSSYPSGLNGPFDSGALQIEYDALVGPYGTPTGASAVTLRGISLQDLTQANQFAGSTLSLSAGMGKGLPLANPSQAGVILVGQVFQSFGNWEGVEQTLDFVVFPGLYTIDNPGNFSFNWPANTQLSDAIRQTLSVAYPNYKISMNISSDFVQSHDECAIFGTLDEFAQLISDISLNVFKNEISISINAGNILVKDSSYSPSVIQLSFTDFVGQPTWIAVNTIQIKMVARADISVGSIIKMPQGIQNLPGIVSTSQAAFPSSVKYKTTFQNNFIVNELRQIGNFRSPDASQWITVANCLVQNV